MGMQVSTFVEHSFFFGGLFCLLSRLDDAYWKSITVPDTKVASFPFILGTSNFLHTDKLCLGIDLSTSEADTGGHKPDFTLTN